MSQSQFMHIETYAQEVSGLSSGSNKKRKVVEITNEATRMEGYCRHIPSPQPAILIHGQHLETLNDRLDAYLKKEGQTVIRQNGASQLRAVRKDAHVLLTGIYSYPMEKVNVDSEKMNQFFQDCVKFHGNEFGDVDSAVLHVDEEYYHIHVYTLSTNAKRLHPGHVTNEQRKKDKSVTLTYRQAMSDLQERFYQSVAINHDMARFGPKRQRMKRAEYLKAKNDAEKEIRYNMDLDEKMKAKQKEFNKKMLVAEHTYLATIARFQDEIQNKKDEIALVSTQLGNIYQLQEDNCQLRSELAYKDALLAKYEDDQAGPR